MLFRKYWIHFAWYFFRKDFVVIDHDPLKVFVVWYIPFTQVVWWVDGVGLEEWEIRHYLRKLGYSGRAYVVPLKDIDHKI